MSSDADIEVKEERGMYIKKITFIILTNKDKLLLILTTYCFLFKLPECFW